jgi:hypothetical protein
MMNHRSSWLEETFKLGALAMLASSCTALPYSNKPPIAVITVTVDGNVVDPKSPMIEFSGEPVTITLDGTKSTDPDGTVTDYRWLRTDVSGSARRAAEGGSAAPPNTAGAGAGGAAAGASAGGAAAGAGAGGARAGAGGAAGAMLPPPPGFVADPAPGVTSDVVLTEAGKYRFTLWVTDDRGTVGKPASVTLLVGPPPMPAAP